MSSEYARVSKPREIEGVLDTFLIRPMGYALVLLLKRTPITPNLVSIASVLAALGAAIAWFDRTLLGAVTGLGFMLLTSALDSADGQLARATGRMTEFGRFLDGLCDNASFLVLYLAIALSYRAHVGTGFGWVLLLGAVAGASHSAQGAAAEYARMLWLHYTIGSPEAARERPEYLRGRLQSSAGMLARLFLHLHFNYSVQQRLLLLSADALQRAHEKAVAARPALREWFGERYAAENRGLVGMWFVGASNIHKVGLVAFAFLPHLVASPFVRRWDQALYFGWVLLLNVPLVLIVRRQAQSDRGLRAELERAVTALG